MTKENIKSWSIPLLIIGVSVIISYAVIDTWINHTAYDFRNCKAIGNCKTITDETIERWGQTGDFLGGILNPLFTFFGLIFVVVTIRQNQKALEHNIDSAKNERFEASFFQLISLFNEAVVSSRIHESNEKSNGRPNGLQFYLGLFDVSHYCKHINSIKNTNEIESIKTVLDAHYHELRLGSNLGGFNLERYFRSLYNIITFIKNSQVCKNDKEFKIFYANTIYAQLTNYEIGLLFYDFLCKDNGEIFRLIEEWGFFEHLNKYEHHPPLSHYALRLGEDKMKNYKTYKDYAKQLG